MGKSRKGVDSTAVLFATTDGVEACKGINRLQRQAERGSDEAKQILARYVREGAIGHMRTHACAALAESATTADATLAPLFREGLADPLTRYWSILGYVRVAGRDAYAELVRVVEDTSAATEDRSHALKCLATASKQPFDRGLTSDAGHWKKSDLRIAEVLAWKAAGFPGGAGYVAVERDPALDAPKTALERAAAKLDKKLSKARKKGQDPANPSQWLAVAQAKELAAISARWRLPAVYLEFLRRFSPINVTLQNKRFWNSFSLFGAAELIDGQHGYSFNPIDNAPITDWPEHLVVIGSHGGDPYVLDLSQSDGSDAPVETAEHGTGEWDFDREADSFVQFLADLAK